MRRTPLGELTTLDAPQTPKLNEEKRQRKEEGTNDGRGKRGRRVVGKRKGGARERTRGKDREKRRGERSRGRVSLQLQQLYPPVRTCSLAFSARITLIRDADPGWQSADHHGAETVLHAL